MIRGHRSGTKSFKVVSCRVGSAVREEPVGATDPWAKAGLTCLTVATVCGRWVNALHSRPFLQVHQRSP